MKFVKHVFPITGLGAPEALPIETEIAFKSTLSKGALFAFTVFAALFPVGLRAAGIIDGADSYNTAAVIDGVNPAICQTAFLLKAPTHVSGIATYHFNHGQGTSPVNITLMEVSRGIFHGPYQSIPSGFDQIVNVDLDLDAGWVQIIDSSLPTWSQNKFSCGCGFARLFGDTQGVVARPQRTTIFDNFNTGGTSSGPSQSNPTTFNVTQPVEITDIETYMFNGGHGTPAGSMTLFSSNGQQYATFPAIGLPWPGTTNPQGAACVPNAEWFASTHILLPPGTYRLETSDNAAWSFNLLPPSNGTGFAQVSVR